jgi:quercetin dioxygenase-like cupin family protein
LAFLGVLGVLAVKEWFRIHRQDAKSAKNFAKQNSFQESKNLRISSTNSIPKGKETMMKKHSFALVLVVVFGALSLAQDSPQKRGAAAAHKSPMMAVSADTLKWGPPPADWVQGSPPPEFSGPRKSQWAVVSGDPSKPGAPFVIRVKSPDGERVPPHWHPQDENLTVLQGTFFLGSGEKFDQSAGHELKAGAYGFMPKKMWHFGWSKGETIVQVHGIGPFKINLGKQEDAAGKPAGSQ